MARHAKRVQNWRGFICECHRLDRDRQRNQVSWLKLAGCLQCLEHGCVALQQRNETLWFRGARLAVVVMVDEQHSARLHANKAEDFSSTHPATFRCIFLWG